jgi:hypothetical protein
MEEIFETSADSGGPHLNSQLREILLMYGEELVAELTNQLHSAGKNGIADTIRAHVTEAAGEVALQLYAADYFVFVDKGRRPGKQPPLDAIEAFCQKVGIPVSAAFPIAQSIGKIGIPPTNVLSKSLQALGANRPGREIAKAIRESVHEKIEKTQKR